jgi:metal-responsive CopG/Arc/MetJ family transcriptional regulator
MSTSPVTKANSRQILVLIPEPVIEIMDRAVRRLDLDRSKFIRAAIREKLDRNGIQIGATQSKPRN